MFNTPREAPDNPVVTHTPSKLTTDLGSLGVMSGDVIMVHASLRAVGPVEGGAAAVVQALEAAVGPTGTIVMNLGARDDFDWVNTRPEAERSTLLENAPAFDKDRTPADPDIGMLAEVFRQLPGTVVSDHPDARFGARGHLARGLLKEPLPWNHYYGPDSVLDRLVGANGKVLRLGASPDTVTLLHLAEYLVELLPSAKSSVTTRFRRQAARHRFDRSPALTTPTESSSGPARTTLP